MTAIIIPFPKAGRELYARQRTKVAKKSSKKRMKDCTKAIIILLSGVVAARQLTRRSRR